MDEAGMAPRTRGRGRAGGRGGGVRSVGEGSERDERDAAGNRPPAVPRHGGSPRAVGTAPLDGDLTGEIGALRVAMARLLAEEEDPVRLANGVARLADAIGRALKAQRTLAGDAGDEVTRTFLRVLAEMDAEAERGEPGEDEDDAWSPVVKEVSWSDGDPVPGEPALPAGAAG